MNKGDILGEAVLLIKKLKDEQDQIRDLLKRQKDLELLNKEMHERLKVGSCLSTYVGSAVA